MEFRLRNKAGSPASLPPMVEKIIKALDKLPDGDMIQGNRGLAEEIRCFQTTISSWSSHAALADYRVSAPHSNAILWANKKTIKAFKKEIRS